MNGAEINIIIDDCMQHALYQPGELVDGQPPKDAVVVDVLMGKFGFHPVRIQECRDKIRSLLLEMPEKFHKGTGDGWSFLNLCNTRRGEQWTSFHRQMEILIALAMAVGMAKFLTPRDTWSTMPGGMPYVLFDTESMVVN